MKYLITSFLFLSILVSCKTQETVESVVANYQKLDIIVLRYSPGDSVTIYPDQYFQLAYPFVTVIIPSDTLVVEDHVAVGW